MSPIDLVQASLSQRGDHVRSCTLLGAGRKTASSVSESGFVPIGLLSLRVVMGLELSGSSLSLPGRLSIEAIHSRYADCFFCGVSPLSQFSRECKKISKKGPGPVTPGLTPEFRNFACRFGGSRG